MAQRIAKAALLVSSTALTATTFQAVGANAKEENHNQNNEDHGYTNSDSTFILMTTPCVNDHQQNNGGMDSGCSPERPICITATTMRQPSVHESGDRCVPCVNEFDTPMDPDLGCSDAEPLCVISIGAVAVANNDNEETKEKGKTVQRRPSFGAAGTTCIPYPCKNTRSNHNDSVEGEDESCDPTWIDEGCTASEPICVDGLGNQPQLGQAGIHCTSFSEQQLQQLPSTETSGNYMVVIGGNHPWGIIVRKLRGRSHNQNQNTLSTKDHIQQQQQQQRLTLSQDPTLWSQAAGKSPLCSACPVGPGTLCGTCEVPKLYSW